MVEPFGAAGLALAALALPAQVFSSCVQAYNTVSDVNAVGRQLSTQFWLFRLQHTRFLVWGQNSNIYNDGITPERMSQPVYDMIVATLMQINDLLQDAEKLHNFYGLKRIPMPDMAESRAAQREIRRQATLVFQVQKSCSIFKKLRWAVHDAHRFSGLVQQLTQFNDALYQFCSLIQRPENTAAVDAEALAMAIVNEGWQGVQLLQQAAAARPITYAVNPELQRNNGPTIGTNIPSSSLFDAYLSGLHVSAAENGRDPPPPLPQFRPSPDIYCDYRQFRTQGLPNDTPNRREWAQWPQWAPGSGMVSCRVVLEWRKYNPQQMDRPQINALQRRVETLTRMLRDAKRPPCVRLLDCLGYVEDSRNPRFGIVLSYPRPYAQTGTPFAPTSLFQIIQRQSYAFLGERFKLAVFLAESLYEIHASRWLHKCLTSHNILFFYKPAETPSSAVPLDGAFLTGFALARPDDPGAHSDEHFPDKEDGIYRHPEVQGLEGVPQARYHNIYDVYSLGTILLEIGTWNTLKNFYKERTNGHAFRTRLIDDKVPMLGMSMGEKYMNAVRKCLSGEFDGMRNFDGSERYTEDYVLNFQRSFYWEVVKELKECHV